jgi:hypothetical protein
MMHWFLRALDTRASRSKQANVDVVFKPTSGAITVEEEGQAIVLDQESGQYFGLNQTAYFLWSGLVGGHTREDVLAAYSEEFALEPSRAAEDWEGLVKELLARRLIK